jgi:hypothetical protein
LRRPFETSIPFFHNQVEVFKDNFPNFASLDVGSQPKFALTFGLARVNVRRLVSLVQVEEEPPPLDQ